MFPDRIARWVACSRAEKFRNRISESVRLDTSFNVPDRIARWVRAGWDVGGQISPPSYRCATTIQNTRSTSRPESQREQRFAANRSSLADAASTGRIRHSCIPHSTGGQRSKTNSTPMSESTREEKNHENMTNTTSRCHGQKLDKKHPRLTAPPPPLFSSRTKYPARGNRGPREERLARKTRAPPWKVHNLASCIDQLSVTRPVSKERAHVNQDSTHRHRAPKIRRGYAMPPAVTTSRTAEPSERSTTPPPLTDVNWLRHADACSNNVCHTPEYRVPAVACLHSPSPHPSYAFHG